MKIINYFTPYFWGLIFFALVFAITVGALISDYMMRLRGLL